MKEIYSSNPKNGLLYRSELEKARLDDLLRYYAMLKKYQNKHRLNIITSDYS